MIKLEPLRALTLALLCASGVALCNTLPPVVAHVVGTGTYTDGSIYVFFDRPISSCSAAGRLDIPVSHPALKNILAIAVTAFASGSAVRIHPGSCGGTVPIFSVEGDSYI